MSRPMAGSEHVLPAPAPGCDRSPCPGRPSASDRGGPGDPVAGHVAPIRRRSLRAARARRLHHRAVLPGSAHLDRIAAARRVHTGGQAGRGAARHGRLDGRCAPLAVRPFLAYLEEVVGESSRKRKGFPATGSPWECLHLWWGPRSSKPVEGLNKALCGFDSHTLPLSHPVILVSRTPSVADWHDICTTKS